MRLLVFTKLLLLVISANCFSMHKLKELETNKPVCKLQNTKCYPVVLEGVGRIETILVEHYKDSQDISEYWKVYAESRGLHKTCWNASTVEETVLIFTGKILHAKAAEMLNKSNH